MKEKKKIIGIVLIAVGVLGAFGGRGQNAAYFLMCAIFVVAGVVLVILKKKDNSTTNANTSQPASQPIEQSAKQSYAQSAELPKEKSEAEKNYFLLNLVEGDNALHYQYEIKLCVIKDTHPHLSGNGGKFVVLKQEPENEYDEFAVAVYLDNEKIGYIYKGQIQDMCNDWLWSGKILKVHINKVLSDDSATLKIGFYSPLSKFKTKQFSLAKTNKKLDEYTTRNDNLSMCEVGDLFEFVQDIDSDDLIAYNDSGEEIGSAPKSLIDLAGDNYKNIVGSINELNEDVDGKIKCKFTAYIIR